MKRDASSTTLPLEGGGQGGGEIVALTLSSRAAPTNMQGMRATLSPSPNPLPSREGAFK